MASQYMRAVFDFVTHESDELPLHTGDIVMVISTIDSNWVRGSVDGKTGNFPCNFVEPIVLPPVGHGQKLFAAIESFPAQAAGDLDFRKGDIILGVKQVDSNWWMGQVGSKSGIFPVTYVRSLDTAAALPIPPRPLSGSAAVTATTTSKPPGVVALARATIEVTAQVDDELSLRVGDIIQVIRCIDADFYYGESNGSQGMFPAAFVEIIEGKENLEQPTSPPAALSKTTKHFLERSLSQDPTISNESKTIGGNDSQKSSAIDNVSASKSFTASISGQSHSIVSSSASANTAESAESVPQSSNITSAYSEQRSTFTEHNGVSESPVPSYSAQVSFTAENTWSHDSSVTPYARTLYPFIAENSNELTFMDNEIVNLICHVDDQWTEGEINGVRGIFPRNYVEIIVDCPSADKCKTLSAVAENQFKTEEKYGRVLYDFNSATDKDLTVREGDSVTILRQVDENWLEARLDDGQTGFVPVNYIETLGSEPLSQNHTNTAISVQSSVDMSVNKSPVTEAVKPVMKPKPDTKIKPARPARPSLVEAPVRDPPDSITKKIPAKPTIASKPVPKARTKSPVFQKSVIDNSDLNDIIKGEMSRARNEAETKSRSNSDADKGKTRSVSTSSMQTLNVQTSSQQQQRHSGDFSNKVLPNYEALRQVNDESSLLAGVSVGQSTFFMNDSLASEKPVPVRMPPAPPAVRQRQTPPSRPRGPSPTKTVTFSGGQTPVPQRPAPPRPSRTSQRSDQMSSQSADDSSLIKFSPGSVSGVDENDNIEIIRDLENRIAEVEQDLQAQKMYYCKYHKSKEELEKSLLMVDEAKKSELEENLAFCLANIQGLSAELKELNENLNRLQPDRAIAEAAARKKAEEAERQKEEEKQNREEMIKKRREQRENVIEELVKTEQDFLRDLQLYISTFLSPQAEKHPEVEMELMFGNIEEVSEVSQKLLLKLEQVQGQDFANQAMGPCFIDLAEDLKTVYAPYCRNHDDVLKLLEKYEDNSSVQEFFSRGVASLRQHTNVFDLGSTLIKPVQRVLKYPLLLNELLKATEEDHTDKSQLLKAINCMTDVATAINEYKRRKDLVLKYRQDTDQSFTERFSKLSLHSIKKKSTRFSQRLAGVQTIDENFNAEEARFKSLEKAVTWLAKDISMFMKQLQDAVLVQEAIANDISDFYIEKSSTQEVDKFQKVQNKIGTTIFMHFKEKVETRVMMPLNALLLMFQGPVKVMKKRYDKLLDYESMSSRLKSMRESEVTRGAKDELEKSRKDYEALNAQLLDELPKLYTMSVSLLQDCMAYLLSAQKTFLNRTLDEMYQLLGLPLILSGGEGNIVEAFNVSHSIMVEKLSALSFIPKTFNPSIEDKKERRKSRLSAESKPGIQDTEMTAQSDSNKVYLRQKYPPDRLFKITQVHQVVQMMDVSFPEGTMVGVIKEQDPMGNKERWFVDNGVSQGFIASKCLGPLKAPEPAYMDNTDLLSTVPSSSPSHQLDQIGAAADFSRIATDLSPPPSYSQTFSTEKSHVVTVSEEKSNMLSDLTSTPTSGACELNNADSFDFDDSSLPWLQSSESSQSDSKKTMPQNQPIYEYYQAVYPFTARSPIEVSLTEGQYVLALEKHDLDGNLEWWLVQVDDKQGYAPANYLYKVE